LREKDDIVHVRCIIKGEPARMIRELKRRGIITSAKGSPPLIGFNVLVLTSRKSYPYELK